MIKNDLLHIVNSFTKKSITLDLTSGNVIVNDMFYDEDPHFIIEVSALNFHLHAQNCFDCNSLINSLGTNNLDWKILYHDKEYIIDFRKSGDILGANKISRDSRQFFNGTKFRFNTLTKESDKLEKELQQAEIIENYEECSILRDLIKKLD